MTIRSVPHGFRLAVREGGHAAVSHARRALATRRERRIIDWVAAGHDRTLRLDYVLTPCDVVLDVGGWEGQWASDIFARFCCAIHVFEPSPIAAAQIERRFSSNPRITVHPYGLAGTNRTARLNLRGQGSSIFDDPQASAGHDNVEIKLRDADEVVRELDIGEIALLKVNIEGGEYELLDRLFACELIGRLRDIQIQFHDFAPDAEAHMRRLQSQLSATHDRTWGVEFVWENWRRRT